MGHLEGHIVFYQWEVLLSHPQNQEGLLVGLLEGNQQESLLYDGMEEKLLHVLTPQVEGWSLFLFWLSQNFVPFSQNYSLDLVGYLSILEGLEVGPSAPEGPGGGCFSWVFLGRPLSVRGRVPTESWE